MVAPGVTVAPAVEIGMAVSDLDTPCLVVDLDRMERNIAAWQADISCHGVRLRPHIKTHKIPDIALQQLAAGAAGIAAAKVSEAEVFAAAGCRDVVIAYPIAGEAKWKRAAEMAANAKMTVNVDSDVSARGLSAAAVARGVTIHLQVEIDTGFHRCGFAPDDIDGIERFCRLIMSLPGVELEGVTTHRGMFFAGTSELTPRQAGHEEGRLLVEVAEKLRARGIPVREVTAGGTITGRYVAEVPGITEVRAGTYVFYDMMQAGYGSATLDDLALSILCTVVSHQGPGRATVDGGSKTFSGDRGVVGQQTGTSQGLAQAASIDAYLERISEEHGMVHLGDGVEVEIGQKIAFYPFHVCTCVNLSDQLVGVRNGTVEKVWTISARGRRT